MSNIRDITDNRNEFKPKYSSNFMDKKLEVLSAWPSHVNQSLHSNIVTGAFDLGKLIKTLRKRAFKGDNTKNHSYHSLISVVRDYRTQYSSNRKDTGRTDSLIDLYMSLVSDEIGTWEVLPEPWKIGEIRTRIDVESSNDNIGKATENLKLEIWEGIKKVPPCKIEIDLGYDYYSLVLSRQDYSFRGKSLLGCRWKKTDEIPQLPIEAFLKEWTIKDLRGIDLETEVRNAEIILRQRNHK